MNVRVPHLNQCCCGCKLETGARVIGWISLIFAILGLTAALLALLIQDEIPKLDSDLRKLDSDMKKLSELTNALHNSHLRNSNFMNASSVFKPPAEEEPSSMYMTRDNIDTSVFLTLGSSFVLAIILLVGVSRRNDKYLNTWVIINFYMAFLYVASYTGNAIVIMIGRSVLAGFLIILFGFLTSLIQLYFICVVHNLRRVFTNEKVNKAKFPVAQNLLTMP